MLKINLLPEEIKTEKTSFLSKISRLQLAVAGVAVLSVLVTLALQLMIIDAKRDTAKLEGSYQQAVATIEKLEKAEREKEALTGKIDALKKIQPEFLWSNFFIELQQRVPSGVWLSKLDGKAKEVVLLSGESSAYSYIGAFLASLQSLPQVESTALKNVKIVEGTGLYQFEILCYLGVNAGAGKTDREGEENS